MDIFFKQIDVGPMGNFAYLLGCNKSHELAVIDPGWDAEKIFKAANEANMDVKAVWLTHTHYDHVQALPDLIKLITVPIYVHEVELNGVPQVDVPVHTLTDGAVLEMGELRVKCHHTPGHSPGMFCFEVANILITGDMLFTDSCGRIDLPGSSPEAMRISLEKLKTLSDDLLVYPGHNYGYRKSTLGEQKKTNPFLQDSVRLRGE